MVGVTHPEPSFAFRLDRNPPIADAFGFGVAADVTGVLYLLAEDERTAALDLVGNEDRYSEDPELVAVVVVLDTDDVVEPSDLDVERLVVPVDNDAVMDLRDAATRTLVGFPRLDGPRPDAMEDTLACPDSGFVSLGAMRGLEADDKDADLL